MAKLRYDFNLLQKICQEECINLLVDYSESKINRDTRIIAKCIICDNSFNKSFNKFNRQRNFGCNLCAKKIKTTRIGETMMEKYGVEHAVHSPIFKEKMKQTTLDRYGVEYGTQSSTFKEKSKKTMMEKYGVEHSSQNEKTKEKKKQTCLKNYGVEYGPQSSIVQEKTKQTNLEKYGVEHPSQNPDVMDNIIKRMYTIKDYVMPSNKTIKIQGYEHFALDELFEKEKITENDILFGCKNVPTIWYEDENGKKRRHFVDFFIISQNRCVEVKSTWTAKQNKHTIFLKQAAGKLLGYKYEIWVYNKKGEGRIL